MDKISTVVKMCQIKMYATFRPDKNSAFRFMLIPHRIEHLCLYIEHRTCFYVEYRTLMQHRISVLMSYIEYDSRIFRHRAVRRKKKLTEPNLI